MDSLIRSWKHVFKLDPDRSLSDHTLERICRSGTDAILVGGSSGLSYDNTAGLLARIRKWRGDADLPCMLEASDEEALVPGFDGYLIPVVLNTPNGEWITGRHQKALREWGDYLDWSRIAAEGYVILNDRSTAARVTGAEAPSTREDLVAYARLADRLFRLPILYIEYSGRFGNMELVRQARDTLEQSRLFYGGGIDSPNKARQAAQAAHTIVVGNALYEERTLEAALQTVQAIHELPTDRMR